MKIKIMILLIFLSFMVSLFPSTQALSSDSIHNNELDAIISNMPLEAKLGQMFMYTFPGKKMSDRFNSILRKYHLGGAILYKSNTESIPQLVTLTDQMQKTAGDIPLFICLDQEGGSVNRLTFGTTMPGNMALGAANSKSLTYDVGRAVGSELHSLGVNTNLAPVLDLATNLKNPDLSIRSFGSDPKLVAHLGAEFIKGTQASETLSVAKHFPGHGDASLDSHFYLTSVLKDAKTLKSNELKPFQKAIETGVDMLMTAHIAYPALDSTKMVSIIE